MQHTEGHQNRMGKGAYRNRGEREGGLPRNIRVNPGPDQGVTSHSNGGGTTSNIQGDPERGKNQERLRHEEGRRVEWSRQALSAYSWMRCDRGPQKSWLHHVGKSDTTECGCGHPLENAHHIVWDWEESFEATEAFFEEVYCMLR